MTNITKYWRDHGTKVLGTSTAIISGFLTIPDLISHPHVKYVAAANVVLGALTISRGFVNTKNLQPPA
jgi:hypothetical protein